MRGRERGAESVKTWGVGSMKAWGRRVSALLIGCAFLAVWTPARAAQRLGFAFPAVKQIPYANVLLAGQRLEQEKGHEFRPVFLRRPELAVQALLRGDVEMIQVNPVAAAQAIHEGAPLVMLMQPLLNHWVLVAPATVAKPEDLSGRRIAVHSETSMSNTVVKHAIRKHNIRNPQILIIPGSPARAQALQSGQIDATSLFLTDVVRLDLDAPGKFKILATFTDVPAPDAVLVARREWAQQNAQMITDMIGAVLRINRRMTTDTGYAIQRAIALYPDEDQRFIVAAVREYVRRGVWDKNGGDFSPAFISRMIRFLIDETKDLPPAANQPPTRYVDFQPFQSVLAQMGVAK